MLTRATALLCVLLFASLCWADALVLDDGTRVEGKIHKQDGQWVVIDAAGHETDVDPDHVTQFILGGNGGAAPTAASADQRLASLRSSAEILPDIHIIIERYNQFIKTNDGTPAADQARTDLSQWQQRLDNGSVKVGPHWLTAAERDQLAADEGATAARIQEMIRQNQTQDAIDAINQALANDPLDPSALYLQGVVFFNQNKVPDSRTSFDKSDKSLPGRWPTLNDLAIIAWRQNQFGVAMNDYVQAMTAAPANQTVLDNVAEALNSLSEKDRQTPPAIKAAALFAKQDGDLAKKMHADGKVRWGATWVAAEDLPKLQAEESIDAQKIAIFQDDLQKTQSAVDQAQQQIVVDQQQMQQMLVPQQVPGGGWTEQIQPIAYQEYQSLAQQIILYQSTIETGRKHINDLRHQMERTPRTLTVPKYTASQTFIGAEGTPIRAASDATTQPALIQ